MNGSKMMLCKSCGASIARSAKVCPSCGAKNKKPFYKRVWFWILVVIAVLLVLGSVGEEKTHQKQTETDWSSVQSLVSQLQDMQPTASPEPADSAASQVSEDSSVSQSVSESTPPQSQTEESQSQPAAVSTDEMRPEFKNAMDQYEEFMDEYCRFMEKYKDGDGASITMVADYAKYMKKYADAMAAFEKWDDGTMNTKETAYYIQVQSRVAQKLLQVNG